MRLDRLAIFSHLWAIAGLSEAARWMWSQTPWSWVLLPVSLALFAFPRSIACLVVYALFQIGFHALASNSPWNHGLFVALMNVAILASVARFLVRRGRPDDPRAAREALFDLLAPPLRLSLILLYGLAFLHKLNSDFLDPENSCVAWLLPHLAGVYRVLPSGVWMTALGIGSTLVVESAVPLLLCFRRTIPLALLLGFCFHLFLSQFGGLFGFAAAMYAIYFLFLPPTFTNDVATRVEAILTGLWLQAIRSWLGPLITVAMVGTGLLLGWRGRTTLDVGLLWWNAWIVAVVCGLAWPFARALRAPQPAALVPAWRPLWVIPLIVLANGLCPYVGLKTETSWAMYSNLRTEIHPNHLFMPSWLKVFGYQDDLVEVLESSLPIFEEARRQKLLVPYFEFQRICSSAGADFRVAYRRNGEERSLAVENGISSDPDSTRTPAWPSWPLLQFRPVDASGPMKCRH